MEGVGLRIKNGFLDADHWIKGRNIRVTFSILEYMLAHMVLSGPIMSSLGQYGSAWNYLIFQEAIQTHRKPYKDNHIEK